MQKKTKDRIETLCLVIDTVCTVLTLIALLRG